MGYRSESRSQDRICTTAPRWTWPSICLRWWAIAVPGRAASELGLRVPSRDRGTGEGHHSGAFGRATGKNLSLGMEFLVVARCAQRPSRLARWPAESDHLKSV